MGLADDDMLASRGPAQQEQRPVTAIRKRATGMLPATGVFEGRATRARVVSATPPARTRRALPPKPVAQSGQNIAAEVAAVENALDIS